MTGNALLTQRIAVAIARQAFVAVKPVMKSVAIRAIKAATWDKDGVTQKRRVETIFAEAERIRWLKRQRFNRLPSPLGPDLAQRLDTLKRQRFGEVLRLANFRRSEPGVHRTELNWVNSPEQVKAEGTAKSGRMYTRSWSRTTDSLHRFYVPRLWYTQTVRQDIAILDGRLTLYARLDGAIPGSDLKNVTVEGGVVEQVRVYEAIWCEQGRGFSLNTRRGAVAVLWARIDEEDRKVAWFHAADTDLGRAFNRAFLGVLHRARAGTHRKRERRPKFDKEERLYGDFTISLEDVVGMGFCEESVRAWCAKTGIELDAGAVTLRRVIEGFRLHPDRRALWLIRHFVALAKSVPPPGARVVFTSEGGFRIVAEKTSIRK